LDVGAPAETGNDLERFFELSYDMLCVLGYDGYYRRVNPAFRRTLGFTEQELLARPFVDFVHPDDRAAASADLGSLARGIQTGVFEERHLHKDGSFRWLHWSAVSSGDGGSCYAVARDVTERKQAEAELAASRIRIVDAADEARRKIERDLHDGAQQRLVRIALQLALARAHVADPVAGPLLDELSQELQTALAELRDLARGIHPAILTDFGLRTALEGLADRAPVPVALRVDLAERLPPSLEAAAYFIAAEALTNVAKYARASMASVSVGWEGEQLLVEIADDGVGGADPAGGSGLRGLADRVEAIGGTLAVVSPPGRGTRVRALFAPPAG
jgi:PAS domain S-box-containing protein